MKFIFHFIAIVASFVLLFSAYGGRVDPSVWILPSFATLVLPIVAVVVLALLALLLLFKQWRSAVILVGALMLSWPTLKLICPVNLMSSDPSPDKTQLKVLTMNVAEFNRTSSEPCKSMRYILDQDADIVVVQEGAVYFTLEQLNPIKPMLEEIYKKYPYRKDGMYDVGILSKYPFKSVKSKLLDDNDLNYFVKMWDVDAPGGNIRVMSMHLSSMRLSKDDSKLIENMNVPSARKQRIKSVANKLGAGFAIHAHQAEVMRKIIDDVPGDVLVMGDMNDTPGSYTYRTLCGEDMHDAWAEAGKGLTYTFRTNHLYVKIDHILYRGDFKALSCWLDKAGDSDHYPLAAVLER